MSCYAGPYNRGIVTNGLVLYYDVNEPVCYSSGRTDIQDLSRNGNAGTLVNGVGYSANNGGSLVFDGVNDYVYCGSSYSNIFSAGLTFCVWAKVPNFSTFQRFLSFNNVANTDYDLFFQIRQTTGVIQAGTAGSAQYRNGVTQVPLNTWFFATTTCSYTSGGFSVYYNGVLDNGTQNGGTPSYVVNKGKLELGRIVSLSLYYYGNVSIASCNIYNRALSPTEIQQNYNATKSRFGL